MIKLWQENFLAFPENLFVNIVPASVQVRSFIFQVFQLYLAIDSKTMSLHSLLSFAIYSNWVFFFLSSILFGLGRFYSICPSCSLSPSLNFPVDLYCSYKFFKAIFHFPFLVYVKAISVFFLKTMLTAGCWVLSLISSFFVLWSLWLTL